MLGNRLSLCLISLTLHYMKAPRFIAGCDARCQNADSFYDLCPYHHDEMTQFYIEQDARFDDYETAWKEMA